MVHGCMVYTELAPRRLQFHVAPAIPALYVHHFSGYLFKKTRYKKLVTHVESHASAVSLVESGEQRYIKAIIIKVATNARAALLRRVIVKCVCSNRRK